MRALFAVILGVAVCVSPARAAPAETKAVLVTGASSGIGRTITERLASKGYFVYAGARKDEDLKALNAIKNVQGIRLDVTDQQQIDAAVDTISKAGRGLYGLVNNAGIATLGSLENMKPEEFDLVMAVNVQGTYRVTRAMAPLIIEQKGRITNIGSLSGTVAMPDLLAYAMSKHAMEAFTDSLAGQMAPLGVQVNVIEPGNYDTQIGRNAAERTGAASRMADRSRFPKPDDVAAAVEQALFDAKPKRRYLVVPVEGEARIVIRKQLEKLVQMNEDQRFTYSRDELVKMLDEALAAGRPSGT
ncbi:NAD(P)-dependent dehydrogenase (short-subunit alcohol dehydrogenase family) [Povalibacter uvarum]|uniref:NAD(P)-dependent dehydrogenase (Short-subunit alcohol dehydrogenase family) n=1 Tax=Povalibacter uvarum TaxID=732238 RepID=A0A841HWM5_9GAMM|nr:SDR family NAD(P)-dependent oxidoreductase [Povalibacter uvarum]MBB6096352.1 NAD(P)-dependent dehydrogenase (short-subunit alcohol dehydrogenase family) [Povalibacter uvarum]